MKTAAQLSTAGDGRNISFALSHLKMASAPHAVVGGDEGLPGKPEPARRAGMRAVAICTSHDADALAGSHVVAQASDYHQLTNKNFLESLHA